MQPTYKDFGWHWTPSDRITAVLKNLSDRGKVFNVWETPQAKSVGRLIKKSPFINVEWNAILPIGEELFVRIARIILGFGDGNMASLPETRSARKTIEQEVAKLKYSLGKLQQIPETAHLYNHYEDDILRPLGIAIEGAQARVEGLSRYEDIYRGTVETFTGKELVPIGNTTRFKHASLAINAVDIFRNATGEVPASGGNSKSFESFLKQFSVGLPGISEVNLRNIARIIWSDTGYKGEIFRPAQYSPERYEHVRSPDPLFL